MVFSRVATLLGHPPLTTVLSQVWEVIHTPHPLKATRPTAADATTADYYNTTGGATTYVHLMQNQRTIPLHKSYATCPERDDGWCELSTVLKVFGGLLDQARYDYSCFGNYPSVPYGNVTNGVPTVKRALGGAFGAGLEIYESSDRWIV